MKTLYLIRHAKSSWEFPHLTDYERPLNDRGKRDAPLMGQRFRARGILPDCLVSSSAARAAETARIIAGEIGFPESEITWSRQVYEAGISSLLKTVEALPDQAESAFLVGHNPGMTYLAEYLSGENISSLPTCGVACMEMDIDTWSLAGREMGSLAFLDYPKKSFTL
jgi:phosphohistidine phosphatase